MVVGNDETAEGLVGKAAGSMVDGRAGVGGVVGMLGGPTVAIVGMESGVIVG